MSIESMFFERLETPIGTLTIAAAMGGLRHIEFPSNRHPVDRFDWAQGARGETADVLRATREQLQEYFAGTRRAFDLPLAPQGTAFQMDVWRLLATIPFGETWSYGDLARAIGKPEATRAVGAANLAIGIHTASQDSTPMFAIVGQVERAYRGREAFQEVDQTASFGRLAKWSAEPASVDELASALPEAVRQALGGRPGPVHSVFGHHFLQCRHCPFKTDKSSCPL
mgnify:CR=1 FL=1